MKIVINESNYASIIGTDIPLPEFKPLSGGWGGSIGVYIDMNNGVSVTGPSSEVTLGFQIVQDPEPTHWSDTGKRVGSRRDFVIPAIPINSLPPPLMPTQDSLDFSPGMFRDPGKLRITVVDGTLDAPAFEIVVTINLGVSSV